MKNYDLWMEARRYNVLMEDVAFEMGISPNSLRRMLRKDLTDEKWTEILDSIHKIGRKNRDVSE